MNIHEVLHALELRPIETDTSAWRHWAECWRIEWPERFLTVLAMGAGEHLAQHGAPLLPPGVELMPFSWEGSPVVPLLKQTENYLMDDLHLSSWDSFYGLHLTGVSEPSVVLCEGFDHKIRSRSIPISWRVYTLDFTDFLLVQLHDLQCRSRSDDGSQIHAGYFESDPDLLALLRNHYPEGPSTVEAVTGERRFRFYGPGVRLRLDQKADGSGEGFWRTSTAAAFSGIKNLLRSDNDFASPLD